MTISIPTLTCRRCGHTWMPRTAHVHACPGCHTKYWDKEKEVLPLSQEARDRKEYFRQYDAKRREAHNAKQREYRLINPDTFHRRDRLRNNPTAYYDGNGQFVKPCADCQAIVFIDQPDGIVKRTSWCEDCRLKQKSIYQKAYYEENKEQIHSQNKEWREENRERLLVEKRAERIRNIDHYRKYDRDRSPQRRQNAKTRDYHRRTAKERYHQTKNANFHSATIRQRDNDICYLCHLPVDNSSWSLDHIIPLTRDGKHTEENVKVAHRVCNSRKSNKLLSELEQRPDGSYVL